MECFIHHDKFAMWSALCKFPMLFSTVKLKLGHNSQFIYRCIIGTFESWSQVVLPNFSQFTNKLKIGIFKCCSSWTSQFSQFMKQIENWDFGIFSSECSSKLFPINKTVGKLGFLGSSLALIFSQDRLSGWVYVLGREIGFDIHYVTILRQFKCWKHCFQG